MGVYRKRAGLPMYVEVYVVKCHHVHNVCDVCTNLPQ